MDSRAAFGLLAIGTIAAIAWTTAGGPLLTVALVILGLIVLVSLGVFFASMVRQIRESQRALARRLAETPPPPEKAPSDPGRTGTGDQ